MLRARIFCLWGGRRSRRVSDDGPAASDAQEVVGESSARKGRSGVFLFLGEVLLSLPQKRRNIDAAALGCVGGREDGSAARAPVWADWRKIVRRRVETPACGGVTPWRPVAAEVPAYPAYRPQISMWEHRAKGIEVSLFSLTLYIQYIIKFGGCQKWKLEEIRQYGKFWKARDCGKWKCGRACVGGNGREVRWLPPNIFFLTFLRFYGILTVFSRREQKERNGK